MINCMFIYLNFWLWFYICLSPHLIAIQVPTALPLKPSNTSAVFISKSPVLNIPPRTRTAPLVWFIPIWVTTILQVHNWSSPMKCMQVLVAVLLCVVFMFYHISLMLNAMNSWKNKWQAFELLSSERRVQDFRPQHSSICPFGLTPGVQYPTSVNVHTDYTQLSKNWSKMHTSFMTHQHTNSI